MKLGIVGLPNVGKSTLFNAITNAGVAAVAFKAVILHITGVVHRVPYAILLDHAVMTGALLPIIGANHRSIGMVIRHLFKLDLS